jgi:hypothetical protein
LFQEVQVGFLFGDGGMAGDFVGDGGKQEKDVAPALAAEIWHGETLRRDTPGSADGKDNSARTTDGKGDSSKGLPAVTIVDKNTPAQSSDKAPSPADKGSSPADKGSSPADKGSSPADKGSSPADKVGPAEANSLLLQAADETVNKSIYKLPVWARLSSPAPGVGCVSSLSNRYREAMRLSGTISSTDDKQYRDLYWVNMDEFNKDMGRSGLLQKVANTDVREGDIIEGLNPNTFQRHVGIVGRVENGLRMVYDNYGGIWRKEPLDVRFGDYKEKDYFRVYLPHKDR